MPDARAGPDPGVVPRTWADRGGNDVRGTPLRGPASSAGDCSGRRALLLAWHIVRGEAGDLLRGQPRLVAVRLPERPGRAGRARQGLLAFQSPLSSWRTG